MSMQTGTENLTLIPMSERSRDARPDLLIRKWFVVLAENFDYVPSDSLVGVWILGLGDLDSQILQRAFEKVLKTWKPEYGRKFPTVADIRCQIDEAQAKGIQLTAEEEFQKALTVAVEFYQPDIGPYRNAPKLSAATWHALKVAGGLEYLQSCSREDLQWARKRFIEDYVRIYETQQVDHLLSDGEATRILARLSSEQPISEKRLTPVPDVSVGKPSVEEVRSVLIGVAGEKPPDKIPGGILRGAVIGCNEAIKKAVDALDADDPVRKEELGRRSAIPTAAERKP